MSAETGGAKHVAIWSKPHAPKFLVDNCVREYGERVRGVEVLQSIQWGSTRVEAWVGKLQGKRMNEPDWLQHEIRAIASVGAAARSGHMTACTSEELRAEAMLGRPGWKGLRGDLWLDVRFEDVPPALERSRFGGLGLDEFVSREHQIQFYEMLLRFARHGVPPQLLEAVSFSAFELASLERISEFAAMCAPLHRTRFCDAFHLWTAMRNDMLFLTTDDKFLAELDLESRWHAILPSEVVTMLNLPIVPLPVDVDEIVDMF